MRIRTMLTAVLAVTFVSLSTLQAANPRPHRRRVAKRRTDRNKDGRVDAKERRMAKKRTRRRSRVNNPWERRADRNRDGYVGRREVRRYMDRNNDGIVGPGERRTFWHTRRAKVTIVVNKYDLDSDGWISGSEAEAWMKDRLRIINTAGLARVDTDIEREFDVNGDGVIDRREAHALRVALGERAIVDKQWEKIADRNKDGKVDAHEAKVFWRKHKSKVDTPIEKKYDADGNGWLSGSEAKKMLGDLATLIKTNGKAKVNTPLEKQFDANADGIIDSAEAQALLDAIDERSVVDTRWESLADKNNDGKVDAKEANIFWKRHKAKVNTPLKKKYDINGDGILTENELKGLLQAQMAMIKTNGKAKVDTGVEKQFDVDDDGAIDFEEAQALIEALKVAAAEKS